MVLSRTQVEYSPGHLAQAASLPHDALRRADGKLTNEKNKSPRAEMQAAVDLGEALKDTSHTRLAGSGVEEEDTMDINMLVLYRTRIGIKYVSTLRGGFQEALHTATNSEDNLSGVKLVDFDRKKYDRARKARIAAQAKRKHNAERTKGSATREGHKYAGDGFATDDRKVETTLPDVEGDGVSVVVGGGEGGEEGVTFLRVAVLRENDDAQGREDGVAKRAANWSWGCRSPWGRIPGRRIEAEQKDGGDEEIDIEAHYEGSDHVCEARAAAGRVLVVEIIKMASQHDKEQGELGLEQRRGKEQRREGNGFARGS